MSQRWWLRKCFGINPRTHRQVGERHRWPDGFGVGQCKYCHRTIYQLRYRSPGP